MFWYGVFIGFCLCLFLGSFALVVAAMVASIKERGRKK